MIPTHTCTQPLLRGERSKGTCLAIFGLLLLIVLSSAGTTLAAERTVDLALIIGNNRHVTDARRSLRFADDDALDAADKLLMFVPLEHIWLLVDPDDETRATSPLALTLPYLPPTWANWERTIREMRDEVDRQRAEGSVRVRVFVHYSGHGEAGGILHFADGLVTAGQFKDGLEHIGADEVFALLDGCHLAQIVRDGNHTRALPPPQIFRGEEIVSPRRPPWLGLIGATTAVREDEYLARGVLALVALTGLLGPADRDGNHQISFREWGQYVASQIDASGEALSVTVVPPRQDPDSVVVDLDASRGIELRFGRQFPSGRLRVLEADDRSVVAELYHRHDRSVSLWLRPGRYLVFRLADPLVVGEGYAARLADVTLEHDSVLLDQSTAERPVLLVPEHIRQRGQRTSSAGLEVMALSERDELALLTSPYRYGARDAIEGLWSYSLLLYNPGRGLSLPGGSSIRPAAALRVDRLIPWWRKGRWLASGGLVFQAGLRVQDAPDYCSPCILPELRLGPTFQQRWLGHDHVLALEVSGGWAPTLITDRLQRLLVHTDSLWSSTSMPNLFLRDTSLETGCSLQFPLGDRWAIGPGVHGEILFHQRPDLIMDPDTGTHEVVWQPTWLWQVTFSIELQQRLAIVR